MLSWVNGCGQTYYGFAPVPDHTKGEDGKYVAKSIRFRRKVNGKTIQFTMRPIINGYSPSMACPDLMHDAGDSTIVHNGNRIFAAHGIPNVTIHDDLGTGVNDTLFGKAVWQGCYADLAVSLPRKFEALCDKHGVEDVRHGNHDWPVEQIRLSDSFIG